MQKPKVSVCIPVYNRKDYIGEAIESVLNQTFSDFELVVSDNCSTDGTIDIVRKYAEKDKRIKLYINERNVGGCLNFNRSLLRAEGEYIKFLFSDDLLDRKCLEVFVDVLDKNPTVSIATSFTRIFGRAEQVRDEKILPVSGLIEGRKAQKSLFFDGYWMSSPSSFIFRRKDLQIGLFNPQWIYWLGDMEFALRLLRLGDAYVVPEVLSYLRLHDEQYSSFFAVNFLCVKEKLLLADTVFRFPHLYGEFTKAEQRRLRRHLLRRLVREGYGRRGLKSKLDMLKIGFTVPGYSRLAFCMMLVKELPRIFRRSRWSEDATETKDFSDVLLP